MDGLRKEAQRKLYRSQKKLSKASTRLQACEAQEEALLAAESPSLEELEALPNCELLRAEAKSEADRLAQLEELVSGLQTAAKDGYSNERATTTLLRLAASLDVSDTKPEPPAPTAKKPKGPRPSTAPRLPYRVYISEGGAEIRVGKQAKDNDILSTDPQHRDGGDWWMHAAGCPGSHVIIREETISSSQLPREVELDAAVLAVNYSKAVLSGSVGVTLCRARQVRKPQGAKPGLVQLSGDVQTIKLNWKNEKHRLDRLQEKCSGARA
jgi:predicted ribosome quality control (RQC) complex YloA/Tae2 family protein